MQRDSEGAHLEKSRNQGCFKYFKNHFKQLLYKWSRGQKNCYIEILTGHSDFSFFPLPIYKCFL